MFEKPSAGALKGLTKRQDSGVADPSSEVPPVPTPSSCPRPHRLAVAAGVKSAGSPGRARPAPSWGCRVSPVRGGGRTSSAPPHALDLRPQGIADALGSLLSDGPAGLPKAVTGGSCCVYLGDHALCPESLLSPIPKASSSFSDRGDGRCFEHGVTRGRGVPSLSPGQEVTELPGTELSNTLLDTGSSQA